MEGVGMNKQFWHNRRVFLTGHTGFKGSWLSLWLQQLHVRLEGFALPIPPTQPCLFELAAVKTGMNSFDGDICNYPALQQRLHRFNPEIVIHMAAQPLVRRSYLQPLQTYATNVMGTVNLLEAVRQCPGVKAVLIVTSDKCYANQEWVHGYRETDPVGGDDPYASSKGCAELVTAAYRRSYFTGSNDQSCAIASARAGNVIGGGDWADERLLPDIMRAFLVGNKVMIRHPQAIRPWQHVFEALHGYLCLCEHLYEQPQRYADAWNFGPAAASHASVATIVEQCSELWGRGAAWQTDNAVQPHENTLLKLDCSKACHYLRWQPQLDLPTAVRWTVDWYQAYQNGKDMRTVCEQQLQEYQRIIMPCSF